GTLFIGLMGLSALLLFRGQLETTRPVLWALMLAFPFPYIATTAGWLTAELGRQPWLIYNLFRTSAGYSQKGTPGDTIFTLGGSAGMSLVVGLLLLSRVGGGVLHGPAAEQPAGASYGGE